MPGNAFSKNLIDGRNKRKMTLKDVAKFVDVSASTLFTWENGAVPRSFDQLKYIARKLELPLYVLLFGEDEPEPLSSRVG